MDDWINRFCKLLDALIAIALAVMVVLVFGNVVLRYAFNTGITVSEELSRWLFVWLTFMGAVVALKDRGHLGTDMLVSRLPRAGKRACAVLGQGLMLWVTWLLFSGSLQQARINANVTAPTSGLSMGIFYSVGVVFAVLSAALLLRELGRALSGRITDDELVMVQESEDLNRSAP
ncbi:MAG: TRAP transporter small permease [Aquincola sp.]|nr:TRAP transporter small permease [Aquincola sp.]